MKYQDAIDRKHYCKYCEEDVKVELYLMDHKGPHYARPACSQCGQYLEGWVGKPKNNNKRAKSKFTPERCNINYCEICGRTKLGSKETLDIHHKHPIEEGGLDERENVVVLCSACHRMCHFLRKYLNHHLDRYYEAYSEPA